MQGLYLLQLCLEAVGVLALLLQLLLKVAIKPGISACVGGYLLLMLCPSGLHRSHITYQTKDCLVVPDCMHQIKDPLSVTMVDECVSQQSTKSVQLAICGTVLLS